MNYEHIDLQEFISRDIEKLASTVLACPLCGKEHAVPFKHIEVGAGILGKTADRVMELGGTGRGRLIFDQKIGEAVAVPIYRKLQGSGLDLELYPVSQGNRALYPDVELSEEIAGDISGKADYLVSVGSGVISDLTKYAAKILDVPYFLVPTAPSMNGYTSTSGAMTIKGVRRSFWTGAAEGIFADTDVIKDAPADMARSGLGDIVSKAVCIADWKLSNLVKNTYFCPVPFMVTEKTERDYLEAAEEIGNRTEAGITVLTEAVLRSGLTMTIVGETTPSSGAEHVLSHYWDLQNRIYKRPKNFHGTQVGVSTLVMLRMYRYIREYDSKRVNLKACREQYRPLEYWERYITESYGVDAPEILEETRAKYLPWQEKEKELGFIIGSWEKLWEELDQYIRPLEPVADALEKSGAAAAYPDLGLSKKDFVDSLLHAKLIRRRYTLLDLLGDLGILEEIIEAVV